MIGVLIIPTGIGAEIGGHAGDGNPVCKLIAGCCDILITHPNVVNASDVNEMPENTLYVEGSMLDRFLNGDFRLEQPKQNKILVAVNGPVRADTINAVNSARVTIGIDAEIMELEHDLRMVAKFKDGMATGDVSGVVQLVEQLKEYEYDALAIHTPIEVTEEAAMNYFKNGGVNPWGGVEAKASRMIANQINKPTAHAPLEDTKQSKELLGIGFDKAVDPRMAPEVISSCYLHCVLKGLNKAPRPSWAAYALGVNDVDFMVAPFRCFGRAHTACNKLGIPIISVKENKTVCDVMRSDWGDNEMLVENYWEAVGVIMSMKAGIDKMSVRRPMDSVKIIKKG